MKRYWILITTLFLLCLGLSGCASSGQAQSGLSASGTIYADQVSISPEMNEKVITVNVQEGQKVLVEEVLFTQDGSTLKAQHEQAQAQVRAAEATLQAAEAQLSSAQVQYDLALAGAYLQDTWKSADLWIMEIPEETGLPAWYYQKNEYLDAVIAEEDAALEAVAQEQANLEKVLAEVSNFDFVAAEKRLVETQTHYQTLNMTRDLTETAQDGEEVREAADDLYQAALTDLEAARLAYYRLLDSESANRVREARAQLAVVQARLDFVRTMKSQMQTGDDSLQVKAALAQTQQAETAIAQAQANLQQAQAGLRLIELQLERAVVKAPLDGTVLALNLEEGEFAAAGSVVIKIGKLDEVRLVVYIPEDRYGSIKLEQSVQVSVDSYPGRVFKGSVVKIADQAEFTPRNVSTEEGRKSTVFAVEILIPNPDEALKPGMPADVVFE